MNYYQIGIAIIAIVVLIVCAFNKTVKEGLTNNDTILLVGDSVLNNSNYVAFNESVESYLKEINGGGGNNVYNYAQDGATITSCYSQLEKIPIDFNTSSTYIFISAGGNNLLKDNVNVDPSIVTKLFNDYWNFIDSVKIKLPNAHIVIINLYLPYGARYQIYKSAVEQWNQLIVANMDKDGVHYNVIDLHKALTTPDDFVYDIEPSPTAAKKIADAINATPQ
jgi:hypothetical protein